MTSEDKQQQLQFSPKNVKNLSIRTDKRNASNESIAHRDNIMETNNISGGSNDNSQQYEGNSGKQENNAAGIRNSSNIEERVKDINGNSILNRKESSRDKASGSSNDLEIIDDEDKERTNFKKDSDVLKLPRKILVSDNKEHSKLGSVGLMSGKQTPSSVQSTSGVSSPVVPQGSSAQQTWNNNVISHLNKSLKAKQRIINTKEPHPKNSTIISEIVNTSPLSSAFPQSQMTTDNEQENVSQGQQQSQPEMSSKPKKLMKKIAKQNSTRTDFFAAKLASAVDDVESSDSDETFVYEGNLNDYDNIGATKPGNSSNPNDNVSLAGSSLINFGSNALGSPAVESSTLGRDDILHPQPAESKQVNSSKLASKNGPSSIPQLDVKPSTLSINNSIGSTTPQETVKRPSNFRSSSSSSVPFSQSHDPGHKLPLSGHTLERMNFPSPSGHLSEGSHSRNSSNHGLALLDNRSYGINSTRNPSINENFNDDHFSYDEVEDDIIDDDASNDGDYFSAQRNSRSSNTTVPFPDIPSTVKQNYANSNHGGRQVSNVDGLIIQTNSVSSKTPSRRSYKPSSTSSKLRSTTSKLFDKKGSQPRRYSIIPDDVDIEDFDDELIYYDRTKFPYNSNTSFNESSQLLNLGHKLPHYRSLNLQGYQRGAPNLKSKRYVSTGQPFVGSNKVGQNFNSKLDMFPFPYPDSQQRQYYNIDEYDENNLQNEEEIRLYPTSKDVSSSYGKVHRLNSPSSHFVLPRKTSRRSEKNASLLKSLIYTIISVLILLSVGFIMGFILASIKDLSNVTISDIDHPIVSQDEIVFNIVIEASNPGLFSITVDQVELDLFAKSGYLDTESTNSNVETVLLGTVYSLGTPIQFDGGFFSRKPLSQITEVRLLTPGKNLTGSALLDDTDPDDNTQKWRNIIEHPFDLKISGILKYELPLTKDRKSVVVNKVGYIDPNQ